MNIKGDFRVCEQCYVVFTQMLENLAESSADILARQNSSTLHFGKKSEEFVRGSTEDPRYNNKLMNKFFRQISEDLEIKRYEQIKDYLDIMLSEEKDTLESKFKRMRRILDSGNIASSYNFKEFQNEKKEAFDEDGPDDHQSTIQNLIMNLEDDSGILGDEINDQLSHFESTKLMVLADNKYNINFKGSNDFITNKNVDNEKNNVNATPGTKKGDERPMTSQRKVTQSKATTGSKLSNAPSFRKDSKPRLSKLNS